MTGRVRVSAVEELPPGDRAIVEVDGRPVGVFNHDGEYYAALNECPHQGGPVCTGLVRGRLVADWPGPGEPTEEAVDATQPTLSCPWHGWEYDLETGRHAGDPDVVLPTFETTVEDGAVFVEY